MLSSVNSSRTNHLLQRPLDTDPQALADLFARHRERLRRMVRLRLDNRLRGRFDSSSVLQQVSLDVARRIREFLAEPSRSFFLWLRTVAGERILELQRRHLSPEAEPAPELTLYRGALPEVHSVSLAAQLLGHRPSNQAALRADQVLKLQRALNGMDPLDHEVLALCHFEELTEGETATVLGLAAPAVTVRYLRALKRLKEILNGIPGFFDRPPGESAR